MVVEEEQGVEVWECDYYVVIVVVKGGREREMREGCGWMDGLGAGGSGGYMDGWIGLGWGSMNV